MDEETSVAASYGYAAYTLASTLLLQLVRKGVLSVPSALALVDTAEQLADEDVREGVTAVMATMAVSEIRGLLGPLRALLR